MSDMGGYTILNKQIHIYSVDTSAFYYDDEYVLHNRMNEAFKLRERIYKLKKKHKKDSKKLNKVKKYITRINKVVEYRKSKMLSKLKDNKGKIRQLNSKYLNKYNIVSVFDSSLTRIIGLKENTLSTDLMIVQVYFFDVIEDMILNGFTYGDERYIFFTASAGQIRTKKTVFIKESVYNEYINTITCGLSIDRINERGGVNINKYLAYLALVNSATDEWKEFDIDKAIVVEDFETKVKADVDLINDETYEIERKEQAEIPITHTDGCGMILPSKSKKAMMIRLPWIKGLLEPFDFRKFIEEANEKYPDRNHAMIKDIYGKDHNVIAEDVEIIFTKSQFKMYKYYDNWDEYKQNYIKYHCQAGKCNEEEDEIKDAKINYQMVQTLTDMENDELEKICARSKRDIQNIGKDKKTMLKVLGVSRTNTNKSFFQQSLEIYPELLNDTYCKEILKQVKKKLVTEAKAAKVSIESKYTFIIPDLYAFCENLFLGDGDPIGLLKDKEVYCRLYKNIKELDCLRSPHLFREHAIRNNVVDEEKERWFITDGLYTSCHDVISKILQFDVDGDRSLVCADRTFVSVAKRNMENILPLYYNMRKAEAVQINNESIFKGLKTAYTGGNIGMISNDITKIWNSENVNLDVIKLLCMENNFTIDYAKTLYKPTRPKEKKNMITDYTKLKVPHFFIYAKDKTKEQVEKVNNSVVNRISKIIKNPNINFKTIGIGKFDYRILMHNKGIEFDEKSEVIIKKYNEVDLKRHYMINKNDDGNKVGNILFLYQDIRKQLLEVNDDSYYVTDVLVKQLYEVKQSKYKTTLWECFGDIIFDNIKNNISSSFTSTILCSS
jgi:hypothetical protein